MVLATNDPLRDAVGDEPCGAGWLRRAAVTAKDLRSEFRTRVALNSLGLFALTTLIAVAYSVGPFRIASEDRPFLLAVLLWIVVFFAALAGLDRSFVKEEESHTAPLLRLSASPLVVWAGKLLFNVVLLAMLLAALVPLYCMLMGYDIAARRLVRAAARGRRVHAGRRRRPSSPRSSRALRARGALFPVLAAAAAAAAADLPDRGDDGGARRARWRRCGPRCEPWCRSAAS